MRPELRPYLLIIFFATLFQYNLAPFLAVLKNGRFINHQMPIYGLVLLGALGLVTCAYWAKTEVLLTLIPLGVISMLYSLPIAPNLKLREIPYLKIFIIALVWACSTVLIPFVCSKPTSINNMFLVLLERFLFIFAITIPFDIRDMKVDKRHGLKTIPLLISENKALYVAYLALALFLLICCAHYANQWFILAAVGISSLATFILLFFQSLRSFPYYYEGLLDGTMFFQGFLVLLFYYLNSLM